MLYHDPHGASCAACHGETGKGGVITEYRDTEGRYRTLTAPDIRDATPANIKKSIATGKGIMPRYFLTDEEIETIHAYLQKVNNKRKTSISKLFETGEENKSSERDIR